MKRCRERRKKENEFEVHHIFIQYYITIRSGLSAQFD